MNLAREMRKEKGTSGLTPAPAPRQYPRRFSHNLSQEVTVHECH